MERVDYESLTLQDLAGMHKRNELDLAPWYQRRSVWTTTQKAYLINSLFVNAPIPTCYVRHYLDLTTERSVKEVVDGQQRIRAIIDYLEGAFAAPQVAGGRPVRFGQLPQSERTRFKMKKISIGYLIGATDADVIDVFGRLNSVAKNLNEQEKRNAKYSGTMKQFCLRKAAFYVDFWRSTKLFSANDISRMQEVQFVSDLTLNLCEGLSDFSQPRLNRFYEQFDEEFPNGGTIGKRFDAVMDQMAGIEEQITTTVFSRSPLFFSLFLLLDRHRFSERRIRRAIADIDALFGAIEEGQRVSAAGQRFHAACTSTTQRIKSRQVRNDYLLSIL